MKPNEKKKKNYKATELVAHLKLYTDEIGEALAVADREMKKHVRAFRELQKEEF